MIPACQGGRLWHGHLEGMGRLGQQQLLPHLSVLQPRSGAPLTLSCTPR